jgi:hypothetical protein
MACSQFWQVGFQKLNTVFQSENGGDWGLPFFLWPGAAGPSER